MDKTAGPLVGVSYVMPIFNEVDYVESAVNSVLAQQFEGPIEIILAVAPSTDGTTEIVHRMEREDDRIHVVDNPGMDIPIGLNLGIAAAQYDVVIRVDAHSELEPGYTTRGVEILHETGAVNVGGIMVAKGRSPFQSCVAKAYNSRLGLGGGAYHSESAEGGPAESAYLGIMRTEVIRSVGGFDETVRRGEDWELNFRLRRAGHLVWLDPHLRTTYWPRENWSKLSRQFLSTGIWRGELGRRLGARNPLRFWLPPLLVISFVLALLAGGLQISGLLTGPASWLAVVLYFGPILYLVFLLAAAVVTGGSLRQRAGFVLVLGTMHLCWGSGFLVGVTRGAKDAVDTSRIAS